MQIVQLPDEIINQIAAGEVIERPASVVKELIDNSIDAGATKIIIRIKKGGLEMIEIEDDGQGIPRDQAQLAFTSHATSKIKNIDDLNKLISMGFRGEALATIKSIATVSMTSKYVQETDGWKYLVNTNKTETAPYSQGTKVTVERIFENIPARLKFLKSAETEYKKIYDLLVRYFLINPQISFVLEKDGKTTINLISDKNIEKGRLSLSRIKEVINKYFEKAIELNFDGQGIKIEGFVGHPETHSPVGVQQYLYVNMRPIKDAGAYKSVHIGAHRFIPEGHKLPFVINITIDPSQVDVNIHPRKEEVRFINQYRIYSSIEQAVCDALENRLKLSKDYSYTNDEFDRLRNRSTSLLADNISDNTENIGYTKSNNIKENLYSSDLSSPQDISWKRFDRKNTHDQNNTSSQLFNKDNINNSKSSYAINKQSNSDQVQQSLQFSAEFLEQVDKTQYDTHNKYLQVFNKYIIYRQKEELWVVDQHAAAERVNFERLLSNLNNEAKNVQKLLIPEEIEVSSDISAIISENIELFNNLGFETEIKENIVIVSSIPSLIGDFDFRKSLISLAQNADDEEVLSSELIRAVSVQQANIIATMACHTSIRTGQKLDQSTMDTLTHELANCKNQYSCPHGRPIIWRLSLPDIDKHFERTY